MTTPLMPARKWLADQDIPQRTFDDKRLPLRRKLTEAGAIVQINKRLFIRPDRAAAVIEASTVKPDWRTEPAPAAA